MDNNNKKEIILPVGGVKTKEVNYNTSGEEDKTSNPSSEKLADPIVDPAVDPAVDVIDNAIDNSTPIQKEELEIDGVLYTVNEKGDAVDSENKTIYTKEQIDSFQDNSNLGENQIDIISKTSGITILDDEGSPIEYEDTIEGFARRETDVKRLGEKEGFDKGFNTFLNANPDIKELIDYKRKFGTIEGFTKNVDYSKITINDSDEESMLSIIYKAEIQKGTSPERAKRVMEFEKANNTLKSAAEESLEYLSKNQKAEIEEKNRLEEESYKEEIKKEINFYGAQYTDKGVVVHNIPNSLYDSVVVTGKIGRYSIPKEGIKIKDDKNSIKNISRQELFDYLAKPIQELDGEYYSAAQLDELNRMSNPQEFALRVIQNLNGGMEQLIESEITSRSISNIRSLRSSDKSKAANKNNNGSNGGRIKLMI